MFRDRKGDGIGLRQGTVADRLDLKLGRRRQTDPAARLFLVRGQWWRERGIPRMRLSQQGTDGGFEVEVSAFTFAAQADVPCPVDQVDRRPDAVGEKGPDFLFVVQSHRPTDSEAADGAADDLRLAGG